MLKFDPITHTYSVGSEILPSITQVLVAEGFINTDFYTAGGRDRGTIIHEVTCLHDSGDLIEDEVLAEYLPYLRAYKDFLKDTGFRSLESETPRYHKTLWYAGTPDRVGEMGKYMAVVDIKSGAVETWHKLQLAAQGELVKQDFNVVMVKRYGLQLRPDGKYRLQEYPDRQDAGMWRSIIAVHNWKKQNLKGGK